MHRDPAQPGPEADSGTEADSSTAKDDASHPSGTCTAASQASLPPWAALARERVRSRLTGGASHPVEVAGYVIEGVLGEGGMGIVYAARHRGTQQRVALKMLHDGDLDRSRLQREFRAAADLAHPNLVSLYELHAHGRELCFTMEIVEGVRLLEFLREPEPAAWPHTRLARLCACLGQLCDALGYVHKRGFVHGDIKPLNCLVEASGRLVLLDFGLARLIDGVLLQAGRAAAGGTPAYMAPELFDGAAASPESDLYALGALLHHVLAGQTPYAGLGPQAMLAEKRSGAPPWRLPAATPEPVPEALLQLRAALMDTDPRERPRLHEVAAVLGGVSGPSLRPSAAPLPELAMEVPFVGRHGELERLCAAAERARAERCCLAVDGRSGVGKSALIEQFISRHVRASALVLRSRCYERESVPYQAFDGLIEQLAVHLSSLPAAEREVLMPRDGGLLARLFPALRELLGEGGARSAARPARTDGAKGATSFDSAARRQEASRALFALLHAVARSRETVLWIDDLQWADQDSTSLLRQWLASEERVPLLLICSFRSEAWTHGRALTAVFPQATLSPSISEHLSLQALPPPEAAELRSLLGADASYIPLGLAVHTLSSVREVVDDRLATLSEPARALLQTIAVARGPLPIEVALAASDADTRWRQLLTELRSCQLLRTDGPGLHDTAEVFHDRLRDAICERIDATVTRGIHGRIAHALLAKGGDDEALYFHFRHAGDRVRALRHGEAAVDRAKEVLAFERGAELAREVLEHAFHPGDVRRLQRKLGDALQNGGHGRQAAAAYLAACEGEPEQDSVLDLRLLAAKELLYAGALPEADRLFAQLFRELDVYFPKTAYDAVAYVVAARVKIAWLRRRVRITPRAQVPKAAVMRMRACWAAAQGMYMIDVVRGSKFAADVFLAALRTGDAYNLAGAYSVEAVNLALRGPAQRAAVQQMQRLACDAAERANGDPYIFTWVDLMQATASIAMGDLHEGIARCRDVERALAHDHVGLWGELSMCRNLLVDSLCLVGEFNEVRERVPAILERAEARGHVYDSVMMRSATSLLRLAADRPADAERELAVIDRDWPGRGYQLAHHRRLFGSAFCLLYRGEGGQAFAAIEAAWPRFRRSLWSMVAAESLLSWTARGLAAVAAFRSSGDARARSVARKAARALDGMGYPTARPTALAIRAALAAQAGAVEEAEALLARAIGELGPTVRPLHAAALQLRRAELAADPEQAATLHSAAFSTFAAQRIENPGAFARLFIP